MKKTFITLSFSVLFSITFAQNEKNVSGDGYIFRFEGTNSQNCKDDKIPVLQPESSYNIDSVSGGSLKITTDGTQLGWHHVSIGLHDQICNSETVDMSVFNEVQIFGTTTAASIPQMILMVMDENGQGPNDNSPVLFNLTQSGQFLKTSSFTDWTSWADGNGTVDPTKVNRVLIYFRVWWNDNDIANGGGQSVIGTHDIYELILGNRSDLTVSVEQELFGNTLKVFPNPASSDLNVRFESSANATITLSDITGKTVMTQSATAGQNNFNFDITDYPKGLYFLNLSTAIGQVTKKVIIQ